MSKLHHQWHHQWIYFACVQTERGRGSAVYGKGQSLIHPAFKALNFTVCCWEPLVCNREVPREIVSWVEDIGVFNKAPQTLLDNNHDNSWLNTACSQLSQAGFHQSATCVHYQDHADALWGLTLLKFDSTTLACISTSSTESVLL